MSNSSVEHSEGGSKHHNGALVAAQPGDVKVLERPPLAGTRQLLQLACIGIGLQFGWAIQLSLLTPYVQELGVPHTFSSYIWLCGPISGFLIQPTVGYFSDKCRSRFGPRRPFIFAGFVAILISALLISFSADIGHLLGDGIHAQKKTAAIVLFVGGFWLLDLANNTLQGPLRALLADLAGNSHKRTRNALAYFTLFLGVGNVLGYGAGTYSGWYKLFPFTKTRACNKVCANLKSTFLIDMVLLTITTIFSLRAVREVPLGEREQYEQQQQKQIELVQVEGDDVDQSISNGQVGQHKPKPFFIELFRFVGTISRQMWFIMAVTAITWIAWFPFLLYDTDWTGKDVYRGEPNSGNQHLTDIYNSGVRIGAFGLILNSVVLAITSIFMERLCKHLGPRNLWAYANLLLGFCFCALIGITKAAHSSPVGSPSAGIIAGILIVFAIIGAPQAVCWNVPYSLIASITRSTGGGHGFSMGILNLAIVIPQMIVSFSLGPFDQLFGGGNVPAFYVGIVAAVLSAVVAYVFVKNPPKTTKLPQTQAGEAQTRQSCSAPLFLSH